MPIPTIGRILGVDWGEVRIGLALSDETQTLASPLETLVRRPGKRFPISRLLDLVQLHHVGGIVVGLPLTPDGSEGASAASARELAGTIADLSAQPVELWDERLTTARALSSVRAVGGSTRGRKAEVDALAAAVLLQNFLDTRRNRAGGAERSNRAEGADGSRQESSDR